MTDEVRSYLKPAAFSQPALSRPIGLVGFMGAGKTTVGQALAARLQQEFIDLDEVIQAHARRTIAEIFEQGGEGAFRRLERQLLEEVLSSRPSGGWVLSLGGGAFIDNMNRELLRVKQVETVFLDAPAEELFRRCAQPGSVRPLLADRGRFNLLLDERRPAYLKAALSVQTAGKEVASIVDEIIARLSPDGASGAAW
ncbi:MAG: shikimate kinase [Acidobacteria bacterium]|nr:shikimate kinase [Acidobacteriota bacterium]